MDLSNWIALGALVVSAATAGYAWHQGRTAARRADVTAFLNWLPARAYINVGGSEVSVGYHLVLWNRGPARARDVDVVVRSPGTAAGADLRLTDIRPDELPLSHLDAGARYPIPWALGADGLAMKDERRFVIHLSWTDSRRQVVEIPVRRGNTGT
jgi:hypothetical protein